MSLDSLLSLPYNSCLIDIFSISLVLVEIETYIYFVIKLIIFFR